MKIIGITGKAGAGKSTFQGYLIEALNIIAGEQVSCATLSIADPIRDALGAMFDLDRHNFMDRTRKEKFIEAYPRLKASPRSLMQSLGTEWGRNIMGEDIWVDMAKAKARKFESNKIDYLVIDDVRFGNEAMWIQAAGGSLVGIKRGSSPEPMNHASEKGFYCADIDWVVNDNSLDYLRLEAHRCALRLVTQEWAVANRAVKWPTRLNDATPDEWDKVTHEAMQAFVSQPCVR